MNERRISWNFKGLGLIDEVLKFNFKNEQLKIPHVGWNTLDLLQTKIQFLMNFNKAQSRYYFVHSYFVNCKNFEKCVIKNKLWFHRLIQLFSKKIYMAFNFILKSLNMELI